MAAMLRLEAQSRIKKKLSYHHDIIFPLSTHIRRYVSSKSLPYVDAASLDSTQEVVRSLVYGRERENTYASDGSLRSLIANPLLDVTEDPDDNNDVIVRQRRVEYMRQCAERQVGSARHLQNDRAWRCISLADMDYELGFQKVVPDGCEQSSPVTGTEYLDRPINESAVFDNQNSDAEELYRPREQDAAAQLLSVPEMSIFHWGGCGQRKLATNNNNNEPTPHYCCSSVPRKRYDTDVHSLKQRHRTALLNQQIECPRNNHVVTHLHNLNVNRPTPIKETDNAKNYIHAFAYTPIGQERIDVLDEVLNHESYLRPDLSTEELAHSYLSEIEIGFLAPHSALQISLDRDQQRRLQETTQSFKEECPAFLRHEKRLVENQQVMGPAFPSPSQLYELGTFRLDQIDLERWQEEPVPASPGMALPRSHQAFRNWTDPRLDRKFARIHDDGEMACPSFSTIREDLKDVFPPYFESNPDQRLEQERSEAK